ncbi:Cullin binding-domain-containing protein [Mycena floridula]|nr:Cullin binding-domain-containing protein [Mycena floridula]
MPPKRKRGTGDDAATETAASTRSTRSSARTSGNASVDVAPATKPKPAAKKSVSKASKKSVITISDGSDEELSEAPPPKKSKTKSTKASTTTKTSKKASRTDEGPKASDLDSEPGPSKASATSVAVAVKPAAPATKAKSTAKIEPYSPARSSALFAKYADDDDSHVITAEGFQRLCTDAEIPLDSCLPMVLSWVLQSKEMFNLTKEEWSKGTDLLKISSLPLLAMLLTDLENLLILGKPSVKKSSSTTKKDEPYDRSTYWKYADDPKGAFLQLYTYCFTLAKPPQSRNIDMGTAVAFWEVLLVPKYPIMAQVVQFVKENEGTYKAANKDLWNMMLEFCNTVQPSLQNYEADGAWPTLLDDFFVWKKAKHA